MPLPTLSQNMATASQQLVDAVAWGAYGDLAESVREELLELARTISGWSDVVATSEMDMQVPSTGPAVLR